MSSTKVTRSYLESGLRAYVKQGENADLRRRLERRSNESRGTAAYTAIGAEKVTWGINWIADLMCVDR